MTATPASALGLIIGTNFSAGTARGARNAEYTFTVINSQDTAIRLHLSKLALPGQLQLAAPLTPNIAIIAAHKSFELSLGIHVHGCSDRIPTRGITIPVSRTGTTWQVVSLDPPGAGPDGIWTSQVYNAACPKHS